jgi:hypothetical protein
VHDVADPSLAAAPDAAIQALFDTGAAPPSGFESAGANILGTNPGIKYPTDAPRIKKQWFVERPARPHDHGRRGLSRGSVDRPLLKIGRQLDLQIAAHILAVRHPPDLRQTDAAEPAATAHRHRTGQPLHPHDRDGRRHLAEGDVGAQVSLAVPIEMNMRHGMPPILKMQSLGMEPSLSVDVECTLTADFFTQMRSTMNVQRALVNQMVLEQGNFYPPNQWPTPAPGTPPLLTTRDVLRYATINGAKALRLDGKTGSLTPGKEADIIILDATSLNVRRSSRCRGRSYR